MSTASSDSTQDGKPRKPGLTLIEVALALAILSGMILALAQARHGLVRQEMRTRNRSTAIVLARSKAEEVKAGLAAVGIGRYDEHAGFAWGVRRRAVEFPEDAETQDARAAMVEYWVGVSYPGPDGALEFVDTKLLLPEE